MVHVNKFAALKQPGFPKIPNLPKTMQLRLQFRGNNDSPSFIKRSPIYIRYNVFPICLSNLIQRISLKEN